MRRAAVRIHRAIAAAAVAVGCVALPAGTAHADTYRYWAYWHGDGDGWTYATTGPATYRPDDGAVEGWRFTAATEAKAARPRTTPAFDRICAGIRIRAGHKRIGLVLDQGTAADAPAGARPPRAEPTTRCAVVPDDATGADVLAQAGRVRYAASGLVCAVGGYPSRGCADAVGGQSSAPTTPASTPSGSRSDSGGSDGGDGDTSAGTTTAVAVGVGVALVAALAGATAVRRRREKD